MEASLSRRTVGRFNDYTLRTLHLQKYNFNVQKKARLWPYNKAGILALSINLEVINWNGFGLKFYLFMCNYALIR